MSILAPEAIARAARSAHDAIHALDVGADTSLRTITRTVEQQRGRPLRVVELAALTNDDICGVWLLTDREDIILHAPSDSRLYVQQFVLHELAHIILRHDAVASPLAGAELLLPDLPATVVRRALNRSRFDNETEVAAEVLADLLAESIRRSSPPRSSFLRVFS